MNGSGKSPAPARPLRWGILGTANISLSFMRGVAASHSSVIAAVASRNPAKAQIWATQHKIPRAFGSYDALLQSGEVDAIYNPLPNTLHAEWTIKALRAGLPVLCEKPLAVNAAEARAIAQAAAETGLPVAEAFMYRFHPQWARVRKLVQSGAIGAVSAMHSQFTFLLDDRSAICASPELAGGALMDVGCYCVNFSRLIAGVEPLWASAFERRVGVDDVMVGLLEFPGGVLAHFETAIANFERHRAEIAGETGAILLTTPWVPGDAPARIVIRRPDVPDEEFIEAPADSYRLEAEDFVAACRGEKPPRWPIADGVANMAVIEALYASARERRAIRIS